MTPPGPSVFSARPRVAAPSPPRLRDRLYPYGYIAPALAFMVVASFLPIAVTIFIAFTNYGAPSHYVSFDLVGLRNFREILGSLNGGDLAPIAIFTFEYACITTAVTFAGGLILAYMLDNENLRERNVYRTLLIIPWALPGTISILAWYGILQDQFGVADSVLINNLHLPDIFFLGDPVWAKVSIILVGFWAGYPFMMTACLGALQSIPPEIMQAAQIDGAGFIQRFSRISFPLLRGATLPLVISAFAFNLNAGGLVILLTQGGPPAIGSAYGGETDVVASYMYKLVTSAHLYGLASAYGILMFAVIGSLSAINMKLTGAFTEAK